MQIDNLQIRRAEPNDSAALHEIFSGPKAYSGTLQLPYPSAEQWRQRLANPDDGTYRLVAVVDGRVVGLAGIHTIPHHPRRRHAAGIGMTVHDDWQGQGIGTALMRATVDMADKWLNLVRLELEVYTDNEAAIRLYERFGFVHEGTLRRHAFRDGQYVDSHVMARLRPDGSRAS
ncbi:MAG TPA: GNAT family N-acetyltransferase [Paucimonas sp.]|nr:GNAT family N-acetyltransferase [Paucimonas sp.]